MLIRVVEKLAGLKDCCICEIGISHYGRACAEGKKIGWREGFRAVYAIVKYNVLR